MPDDVKWDDLRYFLRAVEAGTLAGAARTLEIEHTTIGRRITALERSLGVVLVRRGPEGLQLTDVGAQVVPLAEQMDRAVAAIRAVAAGKRSGCGWPSPRGSRRSSPPRSPASAATTPS